MFIRIILREQHNRAIEKRGIKFYWKVKRENAGFASGVSACQIQSKIGLLNNIGLFKHAVGKG
jgi:hypothetical protein